MGELLTISPALHFPTLQAFEITDSFNGPCRGTWWFRSQGGALRGPFHSDIEANFYIDREGDGA